jgi:hypothetical protein
MALGEYPPSCHIILYSFDWLDPIMSLDHPQFCIVIKEIKGEGDLVSVRMILWDPLGHCLLVVQ